jgi:hypothetical protein
MHGTKNLKFIRISLADMPHGGENTTKKRLGISK